LEEIARVIPVEVELRLRDVLVYGYSSPVRPLNFTVHHKKQYDAFQSPLTFLYLLA
jgi:hypothetical protein